VIQSLNKLFRRIVQDIANGKNIESYVLTLAAFGIALFSVIEDALPIEAQLAVILAGVGLLVFKTTSQDIEKDVDLDSVLMDRQSYGPLREFIRGGRELWVYGPSSVNVLVNSSDLEREILDHGGVIRVALQDNEQKASMEILHHQLDHMSYLLESDIQRSISVLKDMQGAGRTIEYRLVPYSPGYSLLIVDPHGRDGRLVVEFFGYSNQRITERMHMVISRHQSQYWFDYWVNQYELMWEKSRSVDEAQQSGT